MTIRASNPLIARLNTAPLNELLDEAAALRDSGFGSVMTYSPKVFIPLTELCRDVCHYCTYAKTPRRLEQAYLSTERVDQIVDAGAAAGCREALFTLGDKPEQRYRAAREALGRLGCATTIDYLERIAERVHERTGLLPHLNPGVLTREEYRRLRRVAPSMGIMLESASTRLCEPGQPHYGSPDKAPAVRLAAIADAGLERVPLTTGVLIGFGESRTERIDSLLALRELHDRYGHIQEIIVQNFVPKPGTKMQAALAAPLEELLWSIAAARLIFGARMSIQAPPNLSRPHLTQLVSAGINDWGGVSPITPDHVNPESPWPALAKLTAETSAAGKTLAARLTVYPSFIADRSTWIHPDLHRSVLEHADAAGLARDDDWSAGLSTNPPDRMPRRRAPALDAKLARIISRAMDGDRLSERDIQRLFESRGPDFDAVCSAADQLRHSVVGDAVGYVVNRNINYTNLCKYHCEFCAFSKGKISDDLRGAPYVLDDGEIERRVAEAWDRGATEVCLQGGIHPAYTGETYRNICRAVKRAAPAIHIHAFSPLEVLHGATSLNLSVDRYLRELKEAGLASLPGTAAEILDDDVRRQICPDKVTSAQWIEIIEAAHGQGLATTSTVMFGHVETTRHWARHLLKLRDLQVRTGGITEFVPLPFVHMEAPIYRRGRARRGPTYREALLMHAVARLALHPHITNIQASWVKLGISGAADCLRVGANDLGGTLMNESISRAAGASHGQELDAEKMAALIESLGRKPRQRTTLYREPAPDRQAAARDSLPLAPIVNRHAREFSASRTVGSR